MSLALYRGLIVNELCDPMDYPDLIDEIRCNPRTELLNSADI